MVAPGVASIIDTLSVEEKLVPLAGVKVGVAERGFAASVALPLKPQPSIKATRTNQG